jgi:PAS domain S-box-containing protein
MVIRNNMIRNLLTPPIFDDAVKTATAKLLYAIIAIDILLCLVFLIPFIFISPDSITLYISLSLVVLATSIASIIATRKGKIHLASLILVISLWIAIMAGAFKNGGLGSSIFLGSIVIIFVAGMLLGDRAGIITAVASLIAGLLMVTAGEKGIIPPSEGNTIGRLLSYSFFILMIMIFQQFSSRTLREALANAQSELVERLKTEQALRLSEERYRLISSVSSDYMFSSQLGEDGNLRLNWVAGAFEQITGYAFDEYVARGGWTVSIHPEDREQDARDMATLRTNQSVISEVRTIHKNGDIRWVRVYAQPVWDNVKGQLTGIYGAVQEITDAKQAEVELEQHAEEMYILYQMGLVLATGQDLYQTLHKLLEHLRHVFVLDTFFVGVYDKANGTISYPLYVNLSEAIEVPSRKLHDNPGMSGEVIFKQRTIYIPDMDAPAAQKSHAPLVVGKTHIRSFLGIPMMTQGSVIGLISIQSQQPNAYNDRQIRLLETIAAQLGTALEKASLLEKLKQELLDRKYAEEEIRKLNIELEQRVLERTVALSSSESSLRERTIQLEAANKELEAFAYSVSHDLRAPLRAIKGFSQILIKDFATALDGEAVDFLQRISTAASQMSELIESLLFLSRLTRGELNRKEVNLTLLARDILEKMRLQEPERPVTCIIADGLIANADDRLVRTALENLLGNAWKYTSKSEHPIIEMGSLIQDEQVIYFVRDNGVGFDMTHAGKLFGAFQRLHTEAEFPGHGIGLATIQRIIHRHGGVIWAEAEPGKGAIFFFSFGNES